MPRTFAVALLNSIKIASAVTVICLFIGSLAAYALVRIPFGFNRTIQLGILATRMIPEVSLILPLFIIASSLQLINKPIVLIITYMSFALPYAIWMMAAYFQTVPVELEDAARLDGCSRLGILFRVVMPISVPGLISTAMFVFLLAWDEFFYALIFTSTLAAKTVPVAIAEFIGRYVVNVNGMMAGGILAAVPPVVIALDLPALYRQRHDRRRGEGLIVVPGSTHISQLSLRASPLGERGNPERGGDLTRRDRKCRVPSKL